MLENTNGKEVAAGRLELLRQKREKLEAQIAQAEAAEKAKNRKDDTRLKVIVGAAMLADASLHSENVPLIAEVLERAVTSPRDREFLKSKNWIREKSTNGA